MTGGTEPGARSWREWLSTLPTAALLLAVIFLGVGEALHSRLLGLGESIWEGYFLLRGDMVRPACDPHPDIDARVRERLARQRREPGAGLFDASPRDAEAIRESLLAARRQCREKWQVYRLQRQGVSPALRVYRCVEKGLASLTELSLEAQGYMLVALLLLAAATTSGRRHHVALRPARTVLDHRVSAAAQLLANATLLASAWSYRIADYAADPQAADPALHGLWIGGFALLTGLSAYQLTRPPDDARRGGDPARALLTVPLYSVMCLVAGGWFLLAEGHPAGIAIQLVKMQQLSSLFLNVGLYVWVGMLLRRTRLARLVLDVLRPWRLPPEAVAIAVVLVTAVPTAYSGASGIFVIAVGAVIYQELRLAGARRQLALATTAMSGSNGVVLNPCLLVVIVASLNRQVTTTQLFTWGVDVFLLSVVVFAMVAVVTRRNELTAAPPREALPASLGALLPLLPYALIGAGVVAGFELLLDVPFDEFSAPVILPVALLALVAWDRWDARRRERRGEERVEAEGLEPAVRHATGEACEHIGALLMLMALSVSIGGVIERSRLMELFPATFASAWTAMLLLVVVLVVIGMIMDPYGAVILVSATLATVAYDNGIHPIHFWMVVLSAFELGYLTPPVALNQLLTRQVVGEAEVGRARAEDGGFWSRHERLLLPVVVKGSVLLLAAFFPLLVGYY